MNNTFHVSTELLGLIGHPIKQTYSPFIHNITAQMLRLDLIYLPFDIPQANLKDALKGAVALNIKGLNVTVPHKEAVLPLLHTVSEEAAMVGAVNTIVNDMGKLTGYNTDVYGVLETLLPYKDAVAGQEVSVIGAGGAARAVLYTLIRHLKPSAIHIINRTEERAESLKQYFQDKMKYSNFQVHELYPPKLGKVLANSKLIINTTSLGMFPAVDESPVDNPDCFSRGQIVFDTVYNPSETQLLKAARAAGAVPVNGLKMLVLQAAKAFELWTGKEMPVDTVYEGLRKFVNQ